MSKPGSDLRTYVLAAAAVAALLAPLASRAQVADLEVRVVGADGSQGAVEVSLFNSAESFMREPFLQMAGQPVDDRAWVATFFAVPTGEYAVVVVHDENGNGRRDNGLLGIGGEPYGFSNGARPLLGWPDFEDAAFEVREDTGIEIEVE